MTEIFEPTIKIDPVEIFRLSSQGGLEFRYSEGLPFVNIATDGVHNGSNTGAPFDPPGLRRLAKYIERYADRLERRYPFYTQGIERRMVAADLFGNSNRA